MNSLQKEFNITEDNSKKRLDQFLSGQFSNISRSFIQKTIKQGKVLVNDKQKTPHYQLKPGDTVAVFFKGPEPLKLEPEDPSTLDIIYEDENLVVLNKPAGPVVHPTDSHPKGTLANALVAKYPELKEVGENPLRPGIVHRLDRDVSGLMVVARNQESFEHLKKQFKNRQVLKEYTALVHGTPPEHHGTIDLPISRSKTKPGRMAAQTQDIEAKKAETEYEVMEKYNHHTLLKVTPKTGRTHQIRVHLNAIGCPIVGDALYKPRKLKLADLGRIFLHASRLKFSDPKGNKKEFISELPKTLKNFLPGPSSS